MEKVKQGIVSFDLILIVCIVMMIFSIIHNEAVIVLYSSYGIVISISVICILCNIVKNNTIYFEENLKHFTMNKISTLVFVYVTMFLRRNIETLPIFILSAILIGIWEIVHDVYKKGVAMQKVEDETL